MKAIIQKPALPATADRFERLAYNLLALLYELQEETAREFTAQGNRLSALERLASTLEPLVDSDRLIIARICRELAVPTDIILKRRLSRGSAPQRAKVFRALREQEGWSLDRIARAVGFTARGITANLSRFPP